MESKNFKDKDSKRMGNPGVNSARTQYTAPSAPPAPAVDFPPEVAEPYLYLSELNGPAAIDLKMALVRQNDFRSRNSESGYVEDSGAIGGIVATIIVLLLTVGFRVLQLITGGDAEGTAMTLALIVMFLAMAIFLSIVLGGVLELEGFGIGAAIVLTVAYIVLIEHAWAFWVMAGICAVLLVIMIGKIIGAKRSFRRESAARQEAVDRAEEAIFSAFRQTLYDFAGPWDKAPDAVCQLRRIRADGYAKRMEEARRKIRGWKIERHEWRFDLSPSWSDSEMTRQMKSSPGKKTWFDISADDRSRVWNIELDDMTKGDRSAFETIRRAALHGHAHALGVLAAYYRTAEGRDADAVRAMFTAEAGVRANRPASAGGDSELEDGLNAVGVLGLLYLNGNMLIPKDKKIGRSLMEWSAREGSDVAQKWLRDHPS